MMTAISIANLIEAPHENWRSPAAENATVAEAAKTHDEDQEGGREAPVEPWLFLVRRQHPWRKQLYVKGRNLTARQLVGSINANQLDDNTAAQNYRLPIEAVREAAAYVEQYQELLQAEAQIEVLMRKREGGARAPRPLP